MAVNSVSSTSAFNVDGILSGMKTGDLINALSSAEQNAIVQLQQKRAQIVARDKAYQDLNTRVTSFQASLKSLQLSSAINGRSAISATPTIATASANADAANGTFSVNVLAQATSTSVGSGSAIGTAATADGTGKVDSTVLLKNAGLTVPATAGTFTLNGQAITIDPNTQTWADVNTAIQTATGGTVSLSFGQNKVSLVSNGSPMQIGAAADTSNFLTSTHLLGAAQVGSAGTYIVSSNQLLGGAVTSVALSSARLATAINDNGGTGSFTVNGVAINWTANDSLNTVVGRINSSSANVRASYDPTTDKINLVNLGTGAQDVALADTSGNFLAAAGLTGPGAVKTVGSPAQYTITQNGVTTATQYSNTNVVTDALPGITLTLSAVGSSQVTVSQDTQSATRNLQAFVDQFNALVDLIDKNTAYDANTKTGSILLGDASVRMLKQQLRSLVTSPAITSSTAAYKTLGDIGISTGAFGAELGTTKHLTLDSNKLSAALTNNPNAVFDVLSGLTSTATLSSGASNPWAASVTGSPYGVVKSGTYAITHDGNGGLSSVFTPSGAAARPAVTGTITAGATNTTLISGLNLTALGTLPTAAGTDTITYTVTGRGVLQGLNDYLNTVLGADGIFTTQHSGATDDQRTIDGQIATATARLTKKQQDLQKKFTAMEQALGALQNQGASLFSQLNKTSSN
jgi:flagellar hook-associated protein 2